MIIYPEALEHAAFLLDHLKGEMTTSLNFKFLTKSPLAVTIVQSFRAKISHSVHTSFDFLIWCIKIIFRSFVKKKLHDYKQNFHKQTLLNWKNYKLSHKHGCIFFWKIFIFPRSCFMRCFQNSKTSSKFLLQIRIFLKKLKKICKKWGKNTKIKANEQKNRKKLHMLKDILQKIA